MKRIVFNPKRPEAQFLSELRGWIKRGEPGPEGRSKIPSHRQKGLVPPKGKFLPLGEGFGKLLIIIEDFEGAGGKTTGRAKIV